MANPFSVDWNQVPSQVTASFGDLSRFEAPIRDYGIGNTVVMDGNPAPDFEEGWTADFWDSEMELYLPAKLAISHVLLTQARSLAASDADLEATGIRHGQLPMDMIDDLAVDLTAASSGLHLRDIQATFTNIGTALHTFLEEHGCIDTSTLVSERDKKLHPKINTIFPSRPTIFAINSFDQKGIINVGENPRVHIDRGKKLGFWLQALGSDAKPTMEYVGASNIRVNVDDDDRSIRLLGIDKPSLNLANLRETSVDTVNLLTGLCVHSFSYGDVARPYIDPATGTGDRVFSRFDFVLAG